MRTYLRRIKKTAERVRMKLAVKRGLPVRFRFRGKNYYVNPDQSAVYHIVNSTDKIANMADLIPADTKMIFDVGGNCGLFSAFSQISAPDASIHCFEPSAKLLPIIDRNVSKENVHVHGVAVGDRNEDVELYINPQSEQTNSLNKAAVELFASSGSIETKTVKCITLDSFAAENKIERVDVLKVDVQGFEGSVFRGCKNLLPTVEMLFIESTWMDVESIVELMPFALHYGFKYAFVMNPVYMGADILLSRREVTSPQIKLSFAISEELLTRRWS